MGRKQAPEREPAQGGWRAVVRYGSISMAVLLVAAGGLYVYGRIDQFLAGDARFRLAEPAADGRGSPGIDIRGAEHARVPAIEAVFAPDAGRSLYLIPLAQRRRALLAIDWVKDATVSRLWPDRLSVRIVERRPVAFVEIPATGSEGTSRVALIDEEGVILAPPERAKFSLPVFRGITPGQDQALRRQRVAAALKLVKEIGELSRQFSEIDVGDPANIKVVGQAGGRVVQLMLGDRNYQPRLRNFLARHEEMRQRMPDAVAFDLRLDDRITAIGEGTDGG